MPYLECFFNVWNCNADLRLELWSGEPFSTSSLVKGYTIKCPEEIAALSVEYINISGRYPVKPGTLTDEIAQEIEQRLADLEREHPDLMGQIRAGG